MKKIIFLVFVLSFAFSYGQKILVKYEMLQIHPYCGGAKPPREMEEQARIPQPYANLTLIYKSAKGKVDSVKTDDKGILLVNLKAGAYHFFEPWKYYKKTPEGSSFAAYNKTCLEAEWKKEDLKITVAAKGNPIIVNNISTAKCAWNQDCLLQKHFPE